MKFRFVLAAAVAFVLAHEPAYAQTVKIGMITTYSGPSASLGEYMDKGMELYRKLHEKDLPAGVKIEIVKRDDTGPNPEVARRLAQELITRERVNFLAGVVFTPNANAIAPLAGEAKVPFVIMNAAGTNTTTMNPYVTRTSFTLWQSSYPLGQWAAKQPNMKKAYTAVTDYAPGHDGEAAFTKGFPKAAARWSARSASRFRTPISCRTFSASRMRSRTCCMSSFRPDGRRPRS